MKPLAAIQRDQYDYTPTSSYSSTGSEALRGFPTSSALSLAISLKERKRIRTKLHFEGSGILTSPVQLPWRCVLRAVWPLKESWGFQLERV